MYLDLELHALFCLFSKMKDWKLSVLHIKKQCPLLYRWKHSDIAYSRLGGHGQATGLQQLLFNNKSSISILRCQCSQFLAFKSSQAIAWLFTSLLSNQWQLIDSQSSLCFLLCTWVVRAIGFLLEVSAVFQYETFKLSLLSLLTFN